MKKPLMFTCRQKINFILHVFLEILQTCYFRYFGHAWLRTTKLVLTSRRKLSCLSAAKKSTSSPTFSLRYCYDKLVILGNSGMPGYTQPKWYYQLVENFMFICMSKINFIVYFFLGIFHFKESYNLIGQHSILAYKSRTRIFPDMGLMVKYQ